MPPSTRSPSLSDRALSRLRQLFPEARIVRELKESKPAPAVVRTVNARTAPTANVRCTVRARPSPAYARGKCRQHLADALAVCSTLPSTAGPAISGRLGL